MKKNKLFRIIALVILVAQFGVLVPVNFVDGQVAGPIPKSVSSVTVDPGDTVNIRIGPIDPGELAGVADTILTMDISRSMRQAFGTGSCTIGTNCRIDVAKQAFTEGVNILFDPARPGSNLNRTSFVTFYGDNTSPPWPTAFETQQTLTNNPTLLTDRIADINRAPFRVPPPPSVNTGVELGGCTSIGGGVQESLNELAARGTGVRPDYIILATDGLQNYYPSVYDNGILANAIARGVRIYTIGIGIDPNFVDEFTFCAASPGSRGAFVPSGDPARPTDPTRPTRLYNDLNGNGILDGEDYLMDIAQKTGGEYQNTRNAAEFRVEFRRVINDIKFDYAFSVSDVINSDVFDYFNVNTDVTLSDCFGRVIAPVSRSRGAAVFFSRYHHPTDPTLGYSFVLNTGPVPNDPPEVRCIDIRARVKTEAQGVVFGDNQPVDSVDGDITDPRRAVFWEKAIPVVPGLGNLPAPFHIRISNTIINVRNPAFPWIETRDGDVGSIGDISVRRVPSSPAIPAGTHNADFLVIAKESITNFRSAKNWLLTGSSADPYQINLGQLRDYDSLYDHYTRNGVRTCTGSNIPNATGVFQFAGDVSWGGGYGVGACSSGSTGTGGTIIFVDGNLNIGTGTSPTTFNNGQRTVFIVRGNINIHNRMRQINAVLAADGQIVTETGASGNQLTITGAVFSGLSGNPSTEPSMERDLGSSCPGCNRDTPGIRIFMDPKYYYELSQIAGISKPKYKEERP